MRLLLHGVFGLEGLQLLRRGGLDFIRRRDKLLGPGCELAVSGSHGVMRVCVYVRLCVDARVEHLAVVVEAFGLVLLWRRRRLDLCIGVARAEHAGGGHGGAGDWLLAVTVRYRSRFGDSEER